MHVATAAAAGHPPASETDAYFHAGAAGAVPSFAEFDAAWAITMAQRPEAAAGSQSRGYSGLSPRSAPPPPPPPARSPPQRPPGSPQRSGRASPAADAMAMGPSAQLQASTEVPALHLGSSSHAATGGPTSVPSSHRSDSPLSFSQSSRSQSRGHGILGSRESNAADIAAAGGEPTWLARSRHLVVRPGPAADFPAAHLMAALQPVIASSHSDGYAHASSGGTVSLPASFSASASAAAMDPQVTPRLPPAAGGAFAHPLWEAYRRGDDLLLQALQGGAAGSHGSL